MQRITLDLSPTSDYILIAGSTAEVWRNRRVAIYLRDYLHAEMGTDLIVRVPVGSNPIGQVLAGIESSVGRVGIQIERSAILTAAVSEFLRGEALFEEFSRRARDIWWNRLDTSELRQFVQCLEARLPTRRLYPLQLLAAYHLAFAQNAANFSAPGVGKTSIVYGAFSYLNSLASDDDKYINKILVVGPLSSFGPWEKEFFECYGRAPRSHRLSGGVSPEGRRRILYSELPEFRDAELLLTSYQSLPNDLPHLQHFLSRSTTRGMVVLDEAHKIKNAAGGIWAESALNLATFARARVILTGTPAPNGYEDLFNLFRFIWPDHDVIKFHLQHLRDMSQKPFDPRIAQLVENLSPFFIRIRKSDLNLPRAIEHEPVHIQMGPIQEQIYRFIEHKYVSYFRGRDTSSLVRDTLSRARVIRLMQAATNPALLRAPLDAASLGDLGEHTASLFIEDADVLSSIREFSDREVPAKVQAAVALVERILGEAQDNRVVIWCVFVDNLFLISEILRTRGIECRILYGGIPTELDEDPGIETRERIVDEFQSVSSSFRVIVANPFAVGESISLHKTCRHAIYLERNFNAAAFLQSKDRIHRYGLPVDAQVHYYYLCSSDSVDETIHNRLLQKEAAMLRVLESRTIPLISLNMDTTEEDADDVSAILNDYVHRRASRDVG